MGVYISTRTRYLGGFLGGATEEEWIGGKAEKWAALVKTLMSIGSQFVSLETVLARIFFLCCSGERGQQDLEVVHMPPGQVLRPCTPWTHCGCQPDMGKIVGGIFLPHLRAIRPDNLPSRHPLQWHTVGVGGNTDNKCVPRNCHVGLFPWQHQVWHVGGDESEVTHSRMDIGDGKYG